MPLWRNDQEGVLLAGGGVPLAHGQAALPPRRRPRLVVALVLLAGFACLMAGLTGCTAEREQSPAAAPADANGQRFLRGQLQLPARTQLPPDARIDLTLANSQLADTPAAVLARQTLSATAGSRIDFELPLPTPDGATTGLLSAQARDGLGRLLYITARPEVVDAAAQVPVRLSLVAVPGAGPDEPGDAASHRAYDCGGHPVHAVFGGERVALALAGSGRSLLLPAAIAASGARYAIDGNEFWSRGSEASFTLAGQRPLHCRELPEAAESADSADGTREDTANEGSPAGPE